MDCADAARIDELAARIAAGWGQDVHYSALAAVIANLYRKMIAVPAAWPQHRCSAFLSDASDTTASELTTLLDDHLDTVADYGPPLTVASGQQRSRRPHR